jgi:CRISPR-associated protein (TIGR03985 family)
MSFNYEPSVEVLQALVKKPLYEKDMLAKALRIWVISRTLYGEGANSLNLSLDSSFSYSDWHKAFFKQSEFHPNNDNRIQLEIHDPKCPCAYTIIDWLFKNPDFDIDESQWCNDFKSLKKKGKKMDGEELNKLLHPEKTVAFKEVTQKKALLKKEYPKVPEESIDLLFKIINQEISKNQEFSEDIKQEIYQRFSVISQQSLNDIFQEYIKTRSERDTHRPMWGTRRNFTNMFDNLVNELGFLAKRGQQYYKLESLPELLDKNIAVTPKFSTEIIGDSIPNLISWEELFQPINGQQRFFVDLENIIPDKLSSYVDSLNEKLKSIWNLDLIPPIKLIYNSAKNFGEFECVVYPVCLYYIKRAPYLFAYGTTPTDEPELNWYDYRVDRILKLEKLDWKSQEIPSKLKQKYQDKKLPTPKEVQEGIQSAFGYDFYKPQKSLILRFNKYFHGNYIAETERDNLFKTISLQSVENRIKEAQEKDVNSNINKKLLLSRLKTSEYQNSVYCQVNYYLDDNNVIMRLRSWSPNVEVILPWKLRQRMKEDIEKTWKLYESD